VTDPATDPAILAGLARLDGRISSLEHGLREHSEQLAALAPAGPAAPVRAWWWPDLDPTDATAAWGHLGAWVCDALLSRHPTYQRALRPCWRAHPDVVDELTALRLLWLDAYPNPRPAPAAAADYLTRLPVVLARVEAAFKNAGCKTVAGTPVHADNDDHFALAQWDPDQVAAFIEADTTGPPRP
jgi:hypothetical protein